METGFAAGLTPLNLNDLDFGNKPADVTQVIPPFDINQPASSTPMTETLSPQEVQLRQELNAAGQFPTADALNRAAEFANPISATEEQVIESTATEINDEPKLKTGRFTKSEEELIIKELNAGTSLEDIALALNRSPISINNKCGDLQRKGKVLRAQANLPVPFDLTTEFFNMATSQFQILGVTPEWFHSLVNEAYQNLERNHTVAEAFDKRVFTNNFITVFINGATKDDQTGSAFYWKDPFLPFNVVLSKDESQPEALTFVVAENGFIYTVSRVTARVLGSFPKGVTMHQRLAMLRAMSHDASAILGY